MKKIIMIAIACLLSITTAHARAEASFGIGMGSLFGGLGVNLAGKTEHNIFYGAVGCYAIIFSEHKDQSDTCGPSVGWLTEAWWNNKVMLGIYGGNVGVYNDKYRKNFTTEDRYRTDYGVGLSLQYFRSGHTERSVVFGSSLGAGFSDDKNHLHLSFTVGYQF